MTDAGLIYKSYNISTPKFPLISYAATNIFKVYLLDVGLLGAMSNLSPGLLIRGNEIFTGFYGSLVENYAVQQLVGRYRKELFYWTSPGKAEVDFVFPAKESIYPLEVKAGVNLKSKSLAVYNEKYNPGILSRASLLNLKQDKKTCNYPLYALSLFPL